MSVQEVVYLVNGDAGSSEMCYYSNINNSLNGQTPDVVTQITQAPADIIWEGTTVTGKIANFNFTTNINADAFSQPAGTQVGTALYGPIFDAPPPGSPPGSLAYWGYNIFRDNGRVLYNNPAVGNYTSIYTCASLNQVVAGPSTPSPSN